MLGKVSLSLSLCRCLIGMSWLLAALGLSIDQFTPGPWSQVAIVMALVACMLTVMEWMSTLVQHIRSEMAGLREQIDDLDGALERAFDLGRVIGQSDARVVRLEPHAHP